MAINNKEDKGVIVLWAWFFFIGFVLRCMELALFHGACFFLRCFLVRDDVLSLSLFGLPFSIGDGLPRHFGGLSCV